MKQTDWKIIYNKYSGISKRAINLLSREVGRFILREEMVYSIYVLPCEKEGAEVSHSAFFVSLYGESDSVRKFVAREEVPEDGFAVKVVKNPENEEGRLVFLTAHTERELFYAVTSFLDDYLPTCYPYGGANLMPDKTFDYPLPETSYSKVSDHKKRSIFTWGHSINDFRAYIDNMARVRLNELIIWNDYIPINIDEIIEYAHSYGISVILGYSWGWREIGNKATEITEECIEALKEKVVETYRRDYAPVGCDGIYFQSFTERNEERVGGKLISELVTEMVNDIASKLWRITPQLRLIFGLHATSVRNHLKEIALVDPKIEILWEDCGSFPFNYASYLSDESKYEKTLEYVDEILELRGGRGVGFAFKSVMMLDWTKKVGQPGPYVMGENSRDIADHDLRLRRGSWRCYASDWMRYGEYARRTVEFINENQLGDTTLCIAGTFDGGIYLPFALYADMFLGISEPYADILDRVAKRPYVKMD